MLESDKMVFMLVVFSNFNRLVQLLYAMYDKDVKCHICYC